MEETTGAPTSVLPPVGKDEMKKIMVAVDESDVSFYALEWTLENLFKGEGEGEGGATTAEVESGMVIVVHVTNPFQHYGFPAGPALYPPTSVVDSVRKAQDENAAAILSRALQMCKDKMIKAGTLLLKGDPKDMICEAAEHNHVDLLVVGSRGLGTFKRAFLGSVSDYCAHHAKCPILVVKPPKESKKSHSPPKKSHPPPKEPPKEPKESHE